MNEMVGDDTALAAILASAIYSKSVKYVATGCNLLDLRWGPQAVVYLVVEFLSAHIKQ
jgi:chaperonin GroEL